MAEDLFEPLAYEVGIVTVEQTPILERTRLAQIPLDAWLEVAGATLRACAVRPSQVRAVIEIADRYTLKRWVEGYKALTQWRLLAAIRRFYADDLLEQVTRYNPVWPDVVYRVWQDGYHCQGFFSEASVAKRVGVLRDRGILYLSR